LHDEWARLLTTAVLGTDRRPLPAHPGGVTSGFGEGIPDAAVALLDRVAAVSLARKAGACAGPPVLLLAPPSADDRPPCPPAATDRLGALLSGAPGELLREWLQLLVDSGRRLPPEHLPALSLRAARDPALMSLVAEASGPLLPWLREVAPALFSGPRRAGPASDKATAKSSTVPVDADALLAATAPATLLDAATLELLAGTPAPWPPLLGAQVVEVVTTSFHEGRLTWRNQPQLQRLVLALDPAFLGPLVDGIQGAPPLAQQLPVQLAVDDLARTRIAIREELS